MIKKIIQSIVFGIGLLITSYFFGDRGGCNIFPSNAIKKNINTSKFETSEFLDCKLVCNDFSAESLVEHINEGEVIISESNTKSNPREYVIKYNGKKLVFAVDKDHLNPTYLIDDFDLDCLQCDTLSNERNRNIKLPFKK